MWRKKDSLIMIWLSDFYSYKTDSHGKGSPAVAFTCPDRRKVQQTWTGAERRNKPAPSDFKRFIQRSENYLNPFIHHVQTVQDVW